MSVELNGSGGGKRPIQVVVVDDHDLIRRGLVQLLAGAGFAVVGDADDLTGARRLLSDRCPDVVVLDLHLSTGSSLPAIPELLRDWPQTGVVVLSMLNEAAFARAALAAGAVAYVLKDAAATDLAAAVRRAARTRERVCSAPLS